MIIVISYHYTQPLNQTWKFYRVFHRFRKLETPICWFCNEVFNGTDYNVRYIIIFCIVKHFITIPECEVWFGPRTSVETRIKTTLVLETMAHYLIPSKEKRDSRDNFMCITMRKKNRKKTINERRVID